MSSDKSESAVDQWWYCPSEGCDALTRVCHYPDGTTERECQECDWSIEMPSKERVEEVMES